MKKTLMTIAAVICAALTLTLTSCQKDPEKLIIGTWVENEATYTISQGEQTMTLPMLEEGETLEMTFNADLTFTTVYKSNVGDDTSTGTWSMADNKLTIVDDGETVVFNIDKLDKKVCELSYTETEEDEDGPITMTIVIKMTRK